MSGKPKHDSLSTELLYLLGRAGTPLTSTDLYERCELADEVAKVASTLSALKSQGRIVRVDAEGRARYALAAGVAAPAPAGKSGRRKSRETAEAGPSAPSAPLSGIHPDPVSGPPVIDIPSLGEQLAGLNGAAGKTGDQKITPDLDQADKRLADAIIARLKRQFGAVMPGINADLEITTAPAAITINVQRVEINLSLEFGK